MASPFSSNLSLEEIREIQSKFAAERNWEHHHSPRNLLLAMVGEVGELSELFQWRGEVSKGLPGWTSAEREHLGQELSDVLIYLVRLAEQCGVDLPAAVLDKFKLNALKYPPGKEGDSRLNRQMQLKFVQDRHLESYNTPRNLLLGMVGEVGELSELFQWRGEVKKGLPDWTAEDKKHLGQELSDVLLYLVRLAEECKVDLPAAVLEKFKLNAMKYPPGKDTRTKLRHSCEANGNGTMNGTPNGTANGTTNGTE